MQSVSMIDGHNSADGEPKLIKVAAADSIPPVSSVETGGAKSNSEKVRTILRSLKRLIFSVPQLVSTRDTVCPR